MAIMRGVFNLGLVVIDRNSVTKRRNLRMAIKLDFTEKELFEIITNTISDEKERKILCDLVRKRKLIPIKGYGYGLEELK